MERHTYRSEEDKKTIITHLNRIEGQVKGIKKMIEDDRYCDDVLIQLSAVNKSTKSLANSILQMHLYNYISKEIDNQNVDIIEEIVNLFRRFQ